MMRNARGWMRLVVALMIGLVTLAFGPGPALAGGDQFVPAATVNGLVITRYELSQRLAFLEALRQPGASAKQALDDLISDRLQLDAGKALGVGVADAEIQSGMAEFAARANLSVDDFLKAVAQNGVQPETFRDFVKAGLVWRGVLRAKFGGQIRVSEAEVDRAIADGAASGGTLRVLLSEIVMIDDGKSDVRGLAQRVRDRIVTRIDFANAARIFSKAATSSAGGELGWLDVTALPPEVAAAVSSLKPGEITQPIKGQGVVAMYLLRDESQGKGAVRGAPQVDYAVFSPGGARDLARLHAQATDCAALDVAARGLPVASLQRQTQPEATVPAALRGVLASLDAGESAIVPGLTGVPELVMLCARVPQSSVPASRDDVHSSLVNQKLGLLSASYLEELRAQALIVRQ